MTSTPLDQKHHDYCNPFERDGHLQAGQSAVVAARDIATSSQQRKRIERDIAYDAKKQSEDKIRLTRKLSNNTNKYGTIGTNKNKQQQHDNGPFNTAKTAVSGQLKQKQHTDHASKITPRHGVKYWAFWWLARSLAIWAALALHLSSGLLEAAPAAVGGAVGANSVRQAAQGAQLSGADGAKPRHRVIMVEKRDTTAEQQLNGEYLENKPALGDYDKRYDKLDSDDSETDKQTDTAATGDNYPFVASADDQTITVQRRQPADNESGKRRNTDDDDNSDNDGQQLKKINARYLNQALVSRRRKRQAEPDAVVGQVNMRSEPVGAKDNQVNISDLISVDDLREVIADELKQWLEQQRLLLLENARQSLSKKAAAPRVDPAKRPKKPAPIWLSDGLMQVDNSNDDTGGQLLVELDASSAGSAATNGNENNGLFDKSYDELIARADLDGAYKPPIGNNAMVYEGGDGDDDDGAHKPAAKDEPEVDLATDQAIEEKLDEMFVPPRSDSDDSLDSYAVDGQLMAGANRLANGRGDAQVWIQRRRLNRDRALEPAPGQRQQPMRRRDQGDWAFSQLRQQQQLIDSSDTTDGRSNYIHDRRQQQQQQQQQQSLGSDRKTAPEIPALFDGRQGDDDNNGDDIGEDDQSTADNLLLLEVMADQLAGEMKQSGEEKRDSHGGPALRARARPFGRPVIPLRDDEQDQLEADDESATIVNPIITRPKAIADEYNRSQRLSDENSNDNYQQQLDEGLSYDKERKRWRDEPGRIASPSDHLIGPLGASDLELGEQNDEQQLDNLEDIDADLARIRTTSVSPRKRSTIVQSTDSGPDNNYYAQSAPGKPHQSNSDGGQPQTWHHPMLDLASFVEARQRQPSSERLKWRRSFQQQQQPQEKPLVSVLQYRRSISGPSSLPFISQQTLGDNTGDNTGDSAPDRGQFQAIQPNLRYAFPMSPMVFNAASSAAGSNLIPIYPFLPAQVSMLSAADSKQQTLDTNSNILSYPPAMMQSPMGGLVSTTSDYQPTLAAAAAAAAAASTYPSAMDEATNQLQRRRMSDLLEIALDLPRGTIVDIGLNNRQNVVVKINPIYLSDAKISELTSKYDTMIEGPMGANLAVMTISKWDALFGANNEDDTPAAAILDFGTGNQQKQSSITGLKSRAHKLMTQATGVDNQGALAALVQEHHEKLRLMSLVIAFLLAVMVTIIIIRYTGLITLVRRNNNNSKKLTKQLSSSDQSLAQDDSTSAKCGHKYANFLFRGTDQQHNCVGLRAKCSNLCSYARSAYGGLQSKAYKSLHSAPEDGNECADDDQQAVISGTLKGEASPSDNNQQACTKCLSPTNGSGGFSKELARGSYLNARRSSSDSSTKSLITGTSQSATINGHQWGATADDEPIVTSNMDIIAAHMILSYMEEHLNDKDRVRRDWRELCSYESDLKSTNCALMSENRAKNRNQNALAYDHSRVKLAPTAGNAMMPPQQQPIGKQSEQPPASTANKYINANFIYDDDPKRATHIITQAPLKDTVADFWQMVWEQGCSVIVMLTRLSENGVSLCHCYWPMESRNHQVYGDFEIHLVSEHICCQDYLVRNIYLMDRRSLETRTITQFHYLSWPDQSIPSNINKFLEFRRKVNKCYRISSSPIVVHCSDGTGRSGTYTLIDMVLNRISKGAKEIDIAATLEHLRDQRMRMVNNETQFEFVLAAVAEEIQAILKALPQ